MMLAELYFRLKEPHLLCCKLPNSQNEHVNYDCLRAQFVLCDYCNLQEGFNASPIIHQIANMGR